MRLRASLGRGNLAIYRFWARGRSKLFSVLAAGAFASFGVRSVIQTPIRVSGEERIAIGDDVFVGAGSWLQVIRGHGEGVALEIGDGTNIVGACVLSAVRSVRIGRDVLMARNVYIADHMHAFNDVGRPVIKQGITRIAPVEIGDGAWLGQNVVVGPGVRIGVGSIVGANAVLLDDVPDHSVAVGVPARVVRSLKSAATT